MPPARWAAEMRSGRPFQPPTYAARRDFRWSVGYCSYVGWSAFAAPISGQRRGFLRGSIETAASGSKCFISLVAGAGFEPATFGL